MREKKFPIKIEVNGRSIEREVPARMLLSDFIRNELQLPGTHVGCEHGVCGVCNVLVDGRATRSCLTFAVQVDGSQITTVEGLGTVNNLHPLQAAFWEKQGLQCGFCTPGMLLTAKELLARNPNPTREQVAEAIEGNLCRCTGYQNIVDAIMSAAESLRNQVTVQA